MENNQHFNVKRMDTMTCMDQILSDEHDRLMAYNFDFYSYGMTRKTVLDVNTG